MSVISYNNIVLPYPLFTKFDQEAVGDDMGDTDWILSKFDLQAQFLLNSAYLQQLAPGLIVGGAPVTTNPADILSALHSRLMQRRRPLSVMFNNVQLIPQPQTASVSIIGGISVPVTSSGTVDARNGPIPKSCTFVQATNASFLMTYAISAHYWVNYAKDGSKVVTLPVSNQKGNNALFNRWTETVEQDNLVMSTRTRAGKVMIRTDNFSGKIVDQLRTSMAVVGIPLGFLRKSSKYDVTADGLYLNYTIVDEEQFKMPPPPAHEAASTWTKTYGKGLGKMDVRMSITLKGAKFISQSELFLTAEAIARIKMAGLTKNTGVLISHVTGGNMYKNEVTVSYASTGSAVFIDVADAFDTPESDDVFGYSPTYPVLGSVGIANVANNAAIFLTPGAEVPVTSWDGLLRAAAYYDPSITDTVLDAATNQLSRGLQVGEAGKTKEP